MGNLIEGPLNAIQDWRLGRRGPRFPRGAHTELEEWAAKVPLEDVHSALIDLRVDAPFSC